MKTTVFLFLSLIMLSSYSQNQEKIFYNDFVECYFNNETSDSLKIYDKIDGVLLATLKINQDDERYKWFKIAIQKSQNGWAQIENIMQAPISDDSTNSLMSYKNKWIPIQHLKINTTSMDSHDSLGVPFYKLPNINSDLVIKSGKYLTLSLLETNDLWAKVSFVKNEIEYIAWIERKNQCASPWTICSYP
jgi:hypothetical protein